MSDWLRHAIGEVGASAIAGAAGGLVRWLTLREQWRDGIISVIVGALCSVYLGPLALPIMEPVLGRLIVQPDRLSNLSGFLVGIGGIAVSGFVLDLWNARRRQITGGGK